MSAAGVSGSAEPAVGQVKPVIYFVGLTAALAGLLFGLDIGVISGAQEFIQKQFLMGLNKDDFKRYFPHANKQRTQRDPEVLQQWREYNK